jgi:hypothetical protein
MAIYCVPLILPRVKHGAGLLRRTAKTVSGRLTNSSAWRKCRSLFVATPLSGLQGPCICLPARSRFGEGRALFEQPGRFF